MIKQESRLSTSILFVLMLSVICIVGPTVGTAQAAPPNVLIIYADDNAGTLPALLGGFGDIGTIATMDVRSVTPTLSELQAYNVVICWNNYMFADSDAMGNVLADFVDAGGKVIISVFSWYSSSEWHIGGRLVSGGYSPFITENAGDHYSTAGLGTYDAAHPIMQGITSISSYYRDYVSLDPAAYLVASWSDGEEFIATKGNVVAINMYPGPYGDFSGDFGPIYHNAVLYNANSAPSANPVTVSGTTISWTYSDTEGDPQSQYEAQIWAGAGGTGALMWSTSGTGSQTSATYYATLMYGQTYYARVRANDGFSWGAWSETSFIYRGITMILTPNGGEEIPTGSTYRISWTAALPLITGGAPLPADAITPLYKVFHSSDSGTTWTRLADGLTATSYDWYLPAQWGNTKQNAIRVVAYSPYIVPNTVTSMVKLGQDVSDTTFTVSVVKLTSPDLGSITAGSTVRITWDTYLTMRPAAQTAVQINCGSGWSTIATLSGNPGSYSWAVPSALKGASCKAKVILRDRTHMVLGADASNKLFEVK